MIKIHGIIPLIRFYKDSTALKNEDTLPEKKNVFIATV